LGHKPSLLADWFRATNNATSRYARAHLQHGGRLPCWQTATQQSMK